MLTCKMAQSRKYRFATRMNCSNKFTGRNVSICNSQGRETQRRGDRRAAFAMEWVA